jgi:hypothetical protein
MSEIVKLRVEPRGLGDTLKNLTFITGIDKVVEKAASALGIEDCGCKGRQQKLNELFPYRKS